LSRALRELAATWPPAPSGPCPLCSISAILQVVVAVGLVEVVTSAKKSMCWGCRGSGNQSNGCFRRQGGSQRAPLGGKAGERAADSLHAGAGEGVEHGADGGLIPLQGHRAILHIHLWGTAAARVRGR
jgi:hypothetical protein